LDNLLKVSTTGQRISSIILITNIAEFLQYLNLNLSV